MSERVDAVPGAAVEVEQADAIHMVGIGGSGMNALAELLVAMGKRVSGTDQHESAAVARLRAAGATVHVGEHAATLVPAEAQLLVRSSAVPESNPEVEEAQRRGLPALKLAEAVGQLMRRRQGVAIAGTHGKSTTTALVAWLLDQGGLDPLALIGAEALNFASSTRAGHGPMVIEADEYDRRFLQLSPEVAIVTSVEADHLDYFRDVAEIGGVFQQFVDKLPEAGRLVVCADDALASGLRTRAQRDSYGFSVDADWRVADYAPVPGRGSRFTLHHGGRAWQTESSLVGEHNALNAAAAVAVSDYLGIGLRSALAALPTFRGTRRRFETKGRPGDVWIVDDYAHHPTAVMATLQAARSVRASGKVWVVFQPHTSNRTAALFAEFAGAFDAADHALLLPIYRPSGRETVAREVTSKELVEAARARGHASIRHAETFDDAERLLLEGVQAGDLVLTMGAGDVTHLSDRLVQVFGGEGTA